MKDDKARTQLRKQQRKGKRTYQAAMFASEYVSRPRVS